MPVEAVAPAIVWLASDSCSETNKIYNVEAGIIQRIGIVMGPGFHDPHLTPESIAENYAKVKSIEDFLSRVRSSSVRYPQRRSLEERGYVMRRSTLADSVTL